MNLQSFIEMSGWSDPLDPTESSYHLPSPIAVASTRKGYKFISFKVSLKKTLTQNDGFKTLEIIKNAEQGLGLRTIKTIADIFVRDSIEEIQAMIKDTSYAMICNRSFEPKYFDTIEKAIGQIQRVLQTQDYRNREHLVVILRHAPNAWNNKEHFSVYSQDRKFL